MDLRARLRHNVVRRGQAPSGGRKRVIYALDGRRVVALGDYFVAESAAVIGSVVLHDNVSVWFGAVVRGDYDTVTLGANSNIQDCAVVHMDDTYPVIVGEGVTVGHHAVVHGCTIGDNSLIGIHAVVMNGARIGKNCLIGSNALVTEGKTIPDGSLVLGSPGRVVRDLTTEEIGQITYFSNLYVNNFKSYKMQMQLQEEADRE